MVRACQAPNARCGRIFEHGWLLLLTLLYCDLLFNPQLLRDLDRAFLRFQPKPMALKGNSFLRLGAPQ